ncbi:MAG: hypothetical protein LWX11_10840, partial [Firmicutes bacterium]|nr:hypothetical protein [Bacillota bacterium]
LTPFRWEGPGKAAKAGMGLENLRETADTVIAVSNDKLLALCDRNVKTKEAFRVADGVLIQGVRGITDLILRPGILNGDFADVQTVLKNGKEALIGTGQGRGEEAILDALQKALDCPLLERAATGIATQVIVSITADWDRVELSAVETAMRYLQDHYNHQADIKICQVEAPELEDKVLVTVLASGFDQLAEDYAPLPVAPAAEAVVAPPKIITGPVYGDIPGLPDQPLTPTPTRLMPQGPTPSGELAGASSEDLHIPTIIRQAQLRLNFE